MVSAALLICISGLLGSLGLSWHTNYVCKTRDRLLKGLEAPVERVWQGHGGLFRPSTFCKSAASSCSAGFGSNVKTLPMAGTMRCTTRGGTASLARSSGGTEGPRMGNELDEYFRGQLEAAQIAEWNEALATYDRTEAARTERRLNLLRRNGARLLRAFLDDLIFGDRVVDNILARYIFGAAHLQRLDLGRHYSRILPEAQHRQWIQLLERFDQGADADSTSGSSSSSEAGDR